jgi:Domain of unknown function (DUF4132)
MAKTKKVSKKPAAKSKAKSPAPRTAHRAKAEPGWIDAGKGWELGIRDGKLAARKDGEPASVPKPLKDGPIAERLLSAIDFLDDHARTCSQTIESWMLRSLPVPRGVLEQVIADDAWQIALRDAWVVPIDKAGAADRGAGGFFRGVDAKKGIGTVDRDGETTWLDAELVMIPHPVLLDEVDDLRQLAVEIGASQGTSQLFREVFPLPATPPADPMSIAAYAGGEFAQLSFALGLAKRLGYRVRGGAAVCRVLERGRFVEARYDLGDGDPMYETTTGELAWVDDKQRSIAVTDVTPVAFSEGMRMAAQIYAKRKTEEKTDDDA